MKPTKLLLVPFAIALIAGCQTSSDRVAQRENHLAAAGFVIRPANTPERQAMIARLPQHKFVKRVKGDNVQFVYADDTVCGCLYVGNQAAYGKYEQDKQDREQAAELVREFKSNQHSAEDYDFDQQLYDDPAWNWAAWGPWAPEFNYGPGLGW